MKGKGMIPRQRLRRLSGLALRMAVARHCGFYIDQEGLWFSLWGPGGCYGSKFTIEEAWKLAPAYEASLADAWSLVEEIVSRYAMDPKTRSRIRHLGRPFRISHPSKWDPDDDESWASAICKAYLLMRSDYA